MDQEQLFLIDLKAMHVISSVEDKAAGEKELAQITEKNHAGKSDYAIMTLPKFRSAERKKVLSDPLTRISGKEYCCACDILPPLNYERLSDGSERFCMREFYTSGYTTQYFHCQEGWFRRLVDYYDKSTWITHEEVIQKGI